MGYPLPFPAYLLSFISYLLSQKGGYPTMKVKIMQVGPIGTNCYYDTHCS